MNYGQDTQPASPTPEQPFFTAGSGISPEQPENNFDYINQPSDLETSDLSSAHYDTADNTATTEKESPTPPPADEQTPDLGQVTDPNLPPNFNPQTQPSAETKNFDRSNIKTSERLDFISIKETDKIIQRFNQDGDADRFYDDTREMMEANLENSYNRKLAT